MPLTTTPLYTYTTSSQPPAIPYHTTIFQPPITSQPHPSIRNLTTPLLQHKPTLPQLIPTSITTTPLCVLFNHTLPQHNSTLLSSSQPPSSHNYTPSTRMPLNHTLLHHSPTLLSNPAPSHSVILFFHNNINNLIFVRTILFFYPT